MIHFQVNVIGRWQTLDTGRMKLTIYGFKKYYAYNIIFTGKYIGGDPITTFEVAVINLYKESRCRR